MVQSWDKYRCIKGYNSIVERLLIKVNKLFISILHNTLNVISSCTKVQGDSKFLNEILCF